MQDSMRILSAIMFTDIVGYTALMQRDEKKAKKIRDRHRQVLEKLILEHQGKIVQYYGDGTLSIFASAVESVKCAIEIQREFKKEPKIPVRIGLHIGDIVYEDEGVYGDGVNVASRIEAKSVPGAVLISDKLHLELHSHPDLKSVSLGKFELKNVDYPVEIFAMNVEGLVIPTENVINRERREMLKSIAVLPFVNMSQDPENEYFSDGITEEILNALVKVDGLQVTARTSAFAFKGKNADIREIGKQLNVHSVLEGSVRKADNQVRVTAQLINTTDGYHVWSETYNKELKDIFAVQDEIAGRIANTLREKLTGSQKEESLITPPTQNLEAYNLFLKGQFNINKWTPDGARNGIKYLKQAIEMEPNLAIAYSALAFCYTMLGAMGQLPPKDSFPLAGSLADKALELDSNLPPANIAKALVLIFDKWELAESHKYFKKAQGLAPGDGGIYHAYSVYWLAVGNLDEALNYLIKAVGLDPLSLPINMMLAEAFMFCEMYEEALDQIDKTLELDPSFRSAIETKGWIYVLKGDLQKAINTFLEYQSYINDPLKGLTGIGYAYGRAEHIKEAHECLRKLEERESRDKEVTLNMDYVVIFTGLGDLDNAFYHLDKALEEGNGIFFIATHPILRDLRADARYSELLKKYGYEK
jgi:adenylate cyclase